MTSVARGIAKGAAWMVGFRVIDRLLGLVSTVILARLLIPDDFGLIGLAMTLVAAVELLAAFNFDVALIQKRDCDRSHYDTAWTMNVALGVATAGLLAALAAPAAAFYNDARVETVVYALALGRLGIGFSNIGVVDFRKNLEFDREFRFMFARRITMTVVTIAAAYAMRSYWALVLGIVVGNVVQFILSFAMHSFRPRVNLSRRRELMSLSGWLLLNNMLVFLWHRSASILIGRVADVRAVGLYSMAYEIASLPTTELVAPINRAVLPGFAALSASTESLKSSFLQVLSVLSLIVLPAGVGISLVAAPLVLTVLGEKWVDAVKPLEILALSGVLFTLTGNTGTALIAVGKGRVVTLMSLFNVLSMVPLMFYFAGREGAVGAANAVLTSAVLIIPLSYWVTMKYLGVDFRSYRDAMWRPIFATAAMAAAVYQIDAALLGHEVLSSSSTRLMMLIATGVVSYTIVLALLWHISGRRAGAESTIINMVVARFVN